MHKTGYDFVSISSSQTGSSMPPLALAPAKNWNDMLLAAALGIVTIGTGEIASPAPRQVISQTSGITIKINNGARARLADESLLLPQEQIIAIRRYLSLNISDLATTLRVARPTVYAWLRGESEPHGPNLARIQSLYSIGRDWRARSDRPVGPFLKTLTSDGSTLFNQLSEEDLDLTNIYKAFEQIRSSMSSASNRQSISEMARSRGLKPVSRGTQKWSDDTFLGN